MEAINLNNQEIIKAERNKEIKEKIGTNEMKENDNDKQKEETKHKINKEKRTEVKYKDN